MSGYSPRDAYNLGNSLENLSDNGTESKVKSSEMAEIMNSYAVENDLEPPYDVSIVNELLEEFEGDAVRKAENSSEGDHKWEIIALYTNPIRYVTTVDDSLTTMDAVR